MGNSGWEYLGCSWMLITGLVCPPVIRAVTNWPLLISRASYLELSSKQLANRNEPSFPDRECRHHTLGTDREREQTCKKVSNVCWREREETPTCVDFPSYLPRPPWLAPMIARCRNCQPSRPNYIQDSSMWKQLQNTIQSCQTRKRNKRHHPRLVSVP